MKSIEKHEKLDRKLRKDMKSSKKQMKILEKISNADENMQKSLKSVIRPVKS